ncbi:MAG: thiamine-phosphate kinase [Myxococcota bacterium]|nr:thiamine-phosphate kinase [Myxococcota bacterium]
MKEQCLSDVGEAAVIQYLGMRFGRAIDGGIGIGDDGAVFSHANPVVIVADAMVESVHFDREFSPAWSTGYKLVAVNVSDIAAMGGRPTKGLFTLSAPRNLPWAWTRKLIDGVADASSQFGMSIVGGDVTGSPGSISLSLTVLGELIAEKPLRRDAAKPGDTVYVTGSLGSAALGLKALTSRSPAPELVQSSVASLHQPTPRLDAAEALARWKHCLCAMDISDGLYHDAPRLARASGVNLTINLDTLPMSDDVIKYAEQPGVFAVTGGEDYELLFTSPVAPPIASTAIGAVTAGAGLVEYRRQGKLVQIDAAGFGHFSA